MEQYIDIAKSEYRKFLSQEENSTGRSGVILMSIF